PRRKTGKCSPLSCFPRSPPFFPWAAGRSRVRPRHLSSTRALPAAICGTQGQNNLSAKFPPEKFLQVALAAQVFSIGELIGRHVQFRGGPFHSKRLRALSGWLPAGLRRASGLGAFGFVYPADQLAGCLVRRIERHHRLQQGGSGIVVLLNKSQPRGQDV